MGDPVYISGAGGEIDFTVTEEGLYTVMVTDGISTVESGNFHAGYTPPPNMTVNPSQQPNVTAVYSGPGDNVLDAVVNFPPGESEGVSGIKSRLNGKIADLASVGYDTTNLISFVENSEDISKLQRVLMVTEFLLRFEDNRAIANSQYDILTAKWAWQVGTTAAGVKKVPVPFDLLGSAVDLWRKATVSLEERNRWQRVSQALRYNGRFFYTNYPGTEPRPAQTLVYIPTFSSVMGSIRMQSALDAFLEEIENAPVQSDYCTSSQCMLESLGDHQVNAQALASYLDDIYGITDEEYYEELGIFAYKMAEEVTDPFESLKTRYSNFFSYLKAAMAIPSIWETSNSLGEALYDMNAVNWFKPDTGLFLNDSCGQSASKSSFLASSGTKQLSQALSTPQDFLYPGQLDTLRDAVLAQDAEAVEAALNDVAASEKALNGHFLETAAFVSARYQEAIINLADFRSDFSDLFHQNIQAAFKAHVKMHMASILYLVDPASNQQAFLDAIEAVRQANQVAADTAASFQNAVADLSPVNMVVVRNAEATPAATDSAWDYHVQAEVHNVGAGQPGVIVCGLAGEPAIEASPQTYQFDELAPGAFQTVSFDVRLLDVADEDTPVWLQVALVATDASAVSADIGVTMRPNQYKQTIADSGWQFLSVPCQPFDGNAGSNLADDLPEGVTLYHYVDGGYKAYNPNDPQSPLLQSGKGYWLWINNAETVLDVSGRGGSLDGPATVPLVEGWNQIGCPFDFPVAWGAAKVRYDDGSTHIVDINTAHSLGLVNNYISWYENGGMHIATAPDGVIRPWTGYWVWASESCELLFEPDAVQE